MKRVLNLTPTALVIKAGDITRIVSYLEILNGVLPCINASLTRTSVVGVSPAVYLYKINLVDGRLWKQTMTFTNMTNPDMTFQIADTWKSTEYSIQSTVRDSLIELVAHYPTLDSLTYTF